MARGLILFKMRLFFISLLTSVTWGVAPVVLAQVSTEERRPQVNEGGPDIILPAPEPLEGPQADAAPSETENPNTDTDTDTDITVEGEEVTPEDTGPDYSQMSPLAERAAKLDELFVKLAEKEDEQGADLVAEEILAIWMDSGSASVNLLLRRGSDAETRGNRKLARKMYNHAVDLSPEFAEVWARSARLALTQKDYNRALNESLKTLTLEPRHFYSLWTLGNVFEALGRPEDAMEAYRQANTLYPELKAVKDRLADMEIELGGTVL